MEFVNLNLLSEEDRINTMGKLVTQRQRPSAFIVKDEENADRYIKQFSERFPDLKCVKLGRGEESGQYFVLVKPNDAA